MEARKWYEKGTSWVVGNGKRVRFWIDVWLHNCPLRISFPRLYRICRQQEASVADMYEVKWQLDLRRRLGPEELAEWNTLMQELEVVQISERDDCLVWALESLGKFSNRSLYRLMINSGEIDLRMKQVWEQKLPLKTKIFLWMLWHDRVQTGEQLSKRNGKGEKCKYCGALEIRNHLFFNCNIAQVIWVWVRISLRWSVRHISITSFQDMMGIGEVIQEKSLALVMLAAVIWSLWKHRNDWVFNNVLIKIKSPKSIAYRVVGFLT